MAKVLQFKRKKTVTCDNCLQETQDGSSNALWDFILPLDNTYSIHLVIYKSGWTKNEILETTTLEDEENNTSNDVLYLCPNCNKYSSG